MFRWIVLVVTLFTLQSMAETYCAVHIQKIHIVGLILIPTFAALGPLYWWAWKNLYELLGDIWQMGIYCSLPIQFGIQLGTYIVVREVPTAKQLAAMALTLVAILIAS